LLGDVSQDGHGKLWTARNGALLFFFLLKILPSNATMNLNGGGDEEVCCRFRRSEESAKVFYALLESTYN
jgi:hypothetical protein